MPALKASFCQNNFKGKRFENTELDTSFVKKKRKKHRRKTNNIIFCLLLQFVKRMTFSYFQLSFKFISTLQKLTGTFHLKMTYFAH